MFYFIRKVKDGVQLNYQAKLVLHIQKYFNLHTANNISNVTLDLGGYLPLKNIHAPSV